MRADEYRRMDAVEDRMWWYRGLHANLIALLRRHAPLGPGAALLDAGCGTGGLLGRLEAAFPGTRLHGIDADATAVALARRKTRAALCIGSVDALPFADGRLAAIVSADVLYHRGVREAAALAEFHRCLAPGGVLVLNLPAYEWLRGAHDRAVATARRYTARGIRRKLAAAGFRRIAAGYWNGLLFPLMVLRRKLFAATGSASDVALLPAPVERLFGAIVGMETRLVRAGGFLPFGGSVLAVAVK